MFNRLAFIWCAVGLGLATGLSAGSAAQPIDGQIGGQSRAAIRITASVMPDFTVNGPVPMTVGRSGFPEALKLSSNIVGLRFDLVSAGVPDKEHTPAVEVNVAGHDTIQHSDERRILLVVPD
jgi:hypothetical protein